MNPPNNIQNGFFTPVSHFFSKIRKLTVFFRATLTPRLYYNLSVCGWGADGSFVPKNPPFVPCSRRSACSACSLQFFGNKKNHMPDARGACRAYDWEFDSIFPPLPQTSLLEGGGPPAGGGRSFRRWKELRKAPSKLHMLHMHHMPDTYQAYDVFSLFSRYCVLFPQTQPSKKTTFPAIPLSPSP